MNPVSTIRAQPWENLAFPEKHPRVGDANASGTTRRRMCQRRQALLLSPATSTRAPASPATPGRGMKNARRGLCPVPVLGSGDPEQGLVLEERRRVGRFFDDGL